MLEIQRYYKIEDYLKPKKVLVIYGARQVGKTSLVKDFLKTTKLKYNFVTGDNLEIQNLCSSLNYDALIDFAKNIKLLVIDEAQMIPNIGKALKILIDYFDDLQIIVTGSSSFEIAGQIGEPLTGRKISLTLYPIAQSELSLNLSQFELKKNLNDYLIFGSYPEIITANSTNDKILSLEEIASSYLFKDILIFENIKNPLILAKLLKLLAIQLGNEVSLTELGNALQINYKTVAKYIELLSKTFVIFPLHGFSRNLRKELTKKNKYYFFDNGIRNSLISNYNDIESRDDVGKLWENFLIVERMKKRQYQNIMASQYFWRTWQKQEIDLIEERSGKLFGYEFKWRNKKVKTPSEWSNNYENASFEVINQENYLEFVC